LKETGQQLKQETDAITRDLKQSTEKLADATRIDETNDREQEQRATTEQPSRSEQDNP
jgi:hypothetical protein